LGQSILASGGVHEDDSEDDESVDPVAKVNGADLHFDAPPEVCFQPRKDELDLVRRMHHGVMGMGRKLPHKQFVILADGKLFPDEDASPPEPHDRELASDDDE